MNTKHGWMMNTGSRSAFVSLALLCGLVLIPPACAATLDDRCAEGACTARDAATTSDVAVDGGADATPTDPCIGRPTDPVCLDESKALFVSNPNGNDGTGVGTRDKPFKTVNAALAKIDAAKRRIYICEGTYAEDVALTATHSGVSLFGGVDCKWAAASVKPVIGTSANPFKSDGAAGLAIGDIAVEAKDASAGSSIAFFVHGGDVTLRNVRLKAGKGAAGSDGVAAPFTNFPSQTDLNGIASPDTNTGGGERLVTCPGGAQTKGGSGGNPGVPGSPGTPGPANGGTASDCSTVVVGKAASAALGAGGASTPGTLDVTGWLSTPGTKGDTGAPGQGGGGGFGVLGAGGGGGAGGCGGAGGPGGQGGGASIALAALAATVSLSTSVLLATDAGPGGSGAIGQDGQTIFGFRGVGTGNACNGGAGGTGGAGGAGGGGAGGSSFGIVFKGSKPTTDPQTDSAIQFGTKGTGGKLVGTNPGADGLASAVFESK
jgi:hypothetical protein